MNNLLNENETVFWHFSEQTKWSDGSPAQLNRAALFGDGIFETMIFVDGNFRFAKEHEERRLSSMERLKILPNSLDLSMLTDQINGKFEPSMKLRVRWNIYRGGLGKYTPQNHVSENSILIQLAHPAPVIKPRAYISTAINLQPSPWSHCKTLNALPYVMANTERVEMGMDEVILLNGQGFVSESGLANIFWRKGKTFYTPSLSCHCIAGVARRKIIERLQMEDKKVRIGEYVPGDLLSADQVFTSNVTGISYILEIGNRQFNGSPIPYLENLFQ